MTGPAAAAQWYVSHDGQQYGPIGEADLVGLVDSGKLTRDDYVWHPDFDGWKTVEELFPRPPPVPPPPPPRRAAAAPAHNAQPAAPAVVAADIGATAAAERTQGRTGGKNTKKTAKSVAPDYDIEAVEADGAVEVRVRTGSVGRYGAAFFGTILFSVFGCFLLAGGLLTKTTPVVNTGLLLLALCYACIVIARRKKVTTVVIDADGITARGKRYDYEHIAQIGYDGAGGSGYSVTTVSSGAIAQASNALAMSGMTALSHAADMYGHHIYLLYGTKRVSIIPGLTPQNVEIVFERFMDQVRRFHDFGGTTR